MFLYNSTKLYGLFVPDITEENKYCLHLSSIETSPSWFLKIPSLNLDSISVLKYEDDLLKDRLISMSKFDLFKFATRESISDTESFKLGLIISLVSRYVISEKYSFNKKSNGFANFFRATKCSEISFLSY